MTLSRRKFLIGTASFAAIGCLSAKAVLPAFTEDALKDVLKKAWDSGGKPNVMIIPPIRVREARNVLMPTKENPYLTDPDAWFLA